MLLAALLALGAIAPSPVRAQAAPPPDSLLSAGEAVSRVAEEDRLAPRLRHGAATEARLSHVIGDGRLVPGSWVVLVEGADGGPAGIVGVDPATGDFQFETYLDSDYELPTFDAGRVGDVLARNGIEPDDYALDRARLAFIGGKAKGNFWIVPHVSGRFTQSLVVPAFDRRLHAYLEVPTLVELEGGRAYYRLGDGILEQWRKSIGGEPPSPDPVFSLTPGDEPGEGAGERGASTVGAERRPQGPSTSPSARAGSEGRFDRVPGERSPAGARRLLQAGAATDTSIVRQVPVYDQGQTNLCGKYVLAMIHQWWSPEQLGSGDTQVDEIANYLGGSYGGFHRTNWRWLLTPGLTDVMNNWDQVDSDYQDFQSTWSGDTDPIQDGAPTGQSDDLKSWIHHLDAPVAVVGDADGNAPLGHAIDHWVVVTGYSDGDDKLFLNNSGASVGTSVGGTRGAVSYSTWNNDFTDHARSKMVAGYPGDRSHAVAGAGRMLTGGTVEDGGRLELFPVELSVSGDAAAGTDAFGESYRSTVTLEVDRAVGWLVDASAAAFDSATLSGDSSRVTYYRASELGAGRTLGNGRVHLDPFRSGGSRGALGRDSVTVRRVVRDEDDRVHGPTTITVNSTDDPGGTMQMPKPVLRPDTAERRLAVRVEDDDTDGPLVSNPDPAGESVPDPQWPSGAFRLEADVSDPSGLESVAFRYEVVALPADTVVVSRSVSRGVHGSGTYGVDVPRTEWYGQGKITWRVEATDDDADRPGDRSSFTSPRHTVYLPDDDDRGPALEAHRSEVAVDTPASGSGRLRITLEAQLRDSSGVLDDGTYPRVHYRWGPGHRTPTVNDTASDGTLTLSESGRWYRGTTTAPMSRQGETLYWRVEARDTDADRPPAEDRATSWSRVLEAQRPGELCVSPTPADHDFGTVPTSGNATRSWSFTVENCGGEQIAVFGSLEGTLEKQAGSAPSCPHGAGGCWIGVSGLSGARAGGLRLYGGQSETVTVNLDTRGHDYQVPALSPGRYATTIRVRTGQSTVRGTLRVAVPDSTGDVPDSQEEFDVEDLGDEVPVPPERLDEPPLWSGGRLFLGLEGGASMTDLGGGEGRIPADSLNGRLGGLSLRYQLNEVVGLQTGAYYAERGGTRQRELQATRVDLTYLDVPVLLTLSVPTGVGIRPTLTAGGSAAFERSCETTSSYRGDEFFSGGCGEGADVPLELDTGGVDLGVVLGGGLEISAGPGALSLAARYRAGRSTLGSGGGADELRNRSLQFTAGYLFGL